MREFIGLTHLVRINGSLKREALVLDKIGILNCQKDIDLLEKDLDEHFLDELKWLLDRGLAIDIDKKSLKELNAINPDTLSELDGYLSSDFTGPLYAEANKIHQKKELLKELAVRKKEDLIALRNQAISVRNNMVDISVRVAAVQLKAEGQDVVPLLYSGKMPTLAKPAAQADIMRIVVNALPIPDEKTSWEQILEFRSDPDSFGKFLALRRWIGEVAKAQLPPNEVEDQLEWLVYDYQRHLQLHRLKAGMGTFETIITVGSEFLEDLVKVKWSNAAKLLFTFNHRKADLMEAEIKSPGSEVAYILESRKEFGDKA